MFGNNYSKYVDTLRRISGECSKIGIPCADFIEIAQKMLKIKRNSQEFEQKALMLLRDCISYGESRCKVLGLPNVQTLISKDENFLAKGFMYHVSTDDNVDPNIAKFVSYCNINLDMFDTKDMENLQKDIIKRMRLSTSLKDTEYWPKLLGALPEYMKGDYPAKKPSVVQQWMMSIKFPDLKSRKPLTMQYGDCLKQLYPEAKEAYGFIDNPSDLEKELIVLAFNDTRSTMKKEQECGVFSLYTSNNINCIIIQDGTIIWEGIGSDVWATITSGNIVPDAFIKERLSMVRNPGKLKVEQTTKEETKKSDKKSVKRSENGNFVLRNEDGVVVYTSPNLSDIKTFQTSSLSREQMLKELEVSFDMELNTDMIEQFLKECAPTFLSENLPEDPVAKLYCLLPLIKDGKDKL